MNAGPNCLNFTNILRPHPSSPRAHFCLGTSWPQIWGPGWPHSASHPWLRPGSSLRPIQKQPLGLQLSWAAPPVTATDQVPGKSKWTQEQDGSMEIKALECLKIIIFFLWQRKSGWKERISKLHGFSFQKKEQFRDGEGVGKRQRGHNIFWASLQFSFNSWQVSLSIKKKRQRLEK